MRKFLSLILVLVLVSALAIGCSKNNEEVNDTTESEESKEEQNISENNTEDEKIEEIQYSIYLRHDQVPVMESEARTIKENDPRLENMSIEEIALKDLISFNEIESLESPVPKGTKVLDVSKEGSTVIVNLSKEFIENLNDNTTDTNIAVASIVNTVTFFKGNDKVKIMVEGKEIEELNDVKMNREFEFTDKFFSGK
ncbi:GerMN domain-containing protein [Caldisalinibacter kiritimatiensis]|uniref:GerMN domain-containing protein n=1 Tax=Caldisalinibacter kiritimatiensis TaxID=1304284 RepID=R1CF60_9FIRM|nr:GerMN domain-containing protein [Caldisalinibacter kiritimatiensis]EOD00930.1 hypothetical protein L21TH_1038 [Caldisalinibacter kiritimatiensis]